MSTVIPKVDIRERKNEYIMDMELPGLAENDVKIILILSIFSKLENNTDKVEGE